MEWNIENEIKEQLMKAYHQHCFNRFSDEYDEDLLIEIETLENLVDKICINEGIDKKQFLFGGRINDVSN